MKTSTRFYIACASIFLLGLLPVAAAHGHDDEDAAAMDMAAAVMVDSPESVVPNYFRHPEHGGLMIAHIVLMTLDWVFVLPLVVMLSIARSRLALPLQLLFVAVNALAIVLAAVYNGKTPDLYPGNAHNGLGWAMALIVCLQAVAMVVSAAARCPKTRLAEEQVAFIPISSEAIAEHQQRTQHLHSQDPYRFSNDSGQGTERNTNSLRSHSISSLEERSPPPTPLERYGAEDDFEKQGTSEDGSMGRFLPIQALQKLPFRILRYVDLYQSVMNRLILLLGFVALLTGAVTYGGLFRGKMIFSGLAHFIKGGVFFWYGIFTLGRWAGCFADLGWAWNRKPTKSIIGAWASSALSAEFVESFLIFFYGCTNVFLEHLGSSDSTWSPEDLEHVSITILFFGGGLCGMLVESNWVRGLLNANFLTAPPSGQLSLDHDNETLQEPKSYAVSMNPLPALVVLLLGLIMSSHQQASMVSSMIHKQWGTLLAGASLARGITYVLYFLAPPTSFLPSRPPTELVTSFCLMAGGLIFMASSRDTVLSLEVNNLDAMFALTVTMGLVSFLMAWIILVIAIKGLFVRRSGKTVRQYP